MRFWAKLLSCIYSRPQRPRDRSWGGGETEAGFPPFSPSVSRPPHDLSLGSPRMIYSMPGPQTGVCQQNSIFYCTCRPTQRGYVYTKAILSKFPCEVPLHCGINWWGSLQQLLSPWLETEVKTGKLLACFICLQSLHSWMWSISSSPHAPSPEIRHHTEWRTWLFLAYSGGRWLYYQFSRPYLYVHS